jgi:hypothetical protein
MEEISRSDGTKCHKSGEAVMTKLLGNVTLRNTYRVVQASGGDYKVNHKDQRGACYTQDIAAKAVHLVGRQLRGSTVTVSDVEVFLAHAPKSVRGPYDYGYKLHFYAQSVLLVLVATGRASHIKSGRGFEYTILPAIKKRGITPRKIPIPGKGRFPRQNCSLRLSSALQGTVPLGE